MKKAVSVLLSLIFVISNFTFNSAAETQWINPDVPALQLTRENVQEFYILDSQNQSYIGCSFGGRFSGGDGLFNSSEDLYNYIINAVNRIGKVKATGKTTAMREGDAVIFLKDGTRYSYKFEKDGTLNINGACYTTEKQAEERFKKACTILSNSEYFYPYPKWLSWMKVQNIKSITGYTAKDGITKVNKGALATHAFVIYQTIRIKSGERYELGSINLPEGPDTFKAKITFTSGVTYTLIAKNKTLYVESSDMKHGCKYKMADHTANSLNYNFDMWSWAKKPKDFEIPHT